MLKGACGVQGITSRTWSNWLREDPDLADRFEIARARGMNALEREVLDTTDPTKGRVLMHRLGNLDREEWGNATTVTHAGGMTLSEAAAAARAKAAD